MSPINFTLNGVDVVADGDPETPLLYVLRNDFGLNGAKFGCGLGQCGACRVIIAGQIAPSCIVPTISVQGKQVQTLEGIGTPDKLHPLQTAFLREQAAQCGFCTAGMIMAAKALLDQNANPSDVDIRLALERNLCRCGVYDRIRRAVRRAAMEMAR